MTWFSRKQPAASQVLTISASSVPVPAEYAPYVQQAIAADKRVDSLPSIEALNSVIGAWQRVLQLPQIAAHPLLHTVARAEYAMALCSRLSTQSHAGDLET